MLASVFLSLISLFTRRMRTNSTMSSSECVIVSPLPLNETMTQMNTSAIETLVSSTTELQPRQPTPHETQPAQQSQNSPDLNNQQQGATIEECMECAICLEEMKPGDSGNYFECNDYRHAIHEYCFIELLARQKGNIVTCPHCRSPQKNKAGPIQTSSYRPPDRHRHIQPPSYQPPSYRLPDRHRPTQTYSYQPPSYRLPDRYRPIQPPSYRLPDRHRPCDTEGQMRCAGRQGFETCTFNQWVYRPCGPGTTCEQTSPRTIFCDYDRTRWY